MVPPPPVVIQNFELLHQPYTGLVPLTGENDEIRFHPDTSNGILEALRSQRYYGIADVESPVTDVAVTPMRLKEVHSQVDSCSLISIADDRFDWVSTTGYRQIDPHPTQWYNRCITDTSDYNVIWTHWFPSRRWQRHVH